MVLSAGVQAAQRNEPVSAAERDLLRAIPLSVAGDTSRRQAW